MTVFVILIFIFLLQSVWLYISDLAGKDLDAVIIGKLLLFLIPSLIPMVLPLTILVASIMTFGSFSENYEFAAMKSAGISLQRAMRSLILFISLLSVTTFFFANDVIPWSKYKAINLRNNIKKLKPALGIVEGMFNQMEDYNIKVAKKTGKNGQDLHDVIVHKKMDRGNGLIVIKAKRGKLVSSKESDILSFILYDGTVYQPIYSSDYRERRRRPFIKNTFDEYQFNIDLSGYNDVDMGDTQYTDVASMLDVSELRVAVDSLSQAYNQRQDNYANTIMSRNGTKELLTKLEEKTPETKLEIKDKHDIDSRHLKQDTISYNFANLSEFYQSYSLRTNMRVVNLALTSSQGTLRTIQSKNDSFKREMKKLNKAEIEIHDKFALAIMCYVLFFVGAPMGAIIRKGGIGLPMVVAILLFLIYYYIGMFAKNSAENNSISPFIATWLSTFIMLPLSVYVTYRATTDQGLVNFDFITVPLQNFFRKIGLDKLKKKK